VGTGPHEVAVSPDGRLALVSNYGAESPGSTLTLIDVAAARAVKTIDLGENARPHGIQFLPGGRRALVTCEVQKKLLVVDGESGAVASAIPTDQLLSHMVVASPDGSRAFVANIGSGSVTVVDLALSKATKTIATGAGCEGIAITPDGKTVWTTN